MATLTKMLEDAHVPVPTTKKVIKEWLKNIVMPTHYAKGRNDSEFNVTEFLRNFLIARMDER